MVLSRSGTVSGIAKSRKSRHRWVCALQIMSVVLMVTSSGRFLSNGIDAEAVISASGSSESAAVKEDLKEEPTDSSGLHVGREYLSHLESLPPISKIVHIMFPNATTLPENIEKFELFRHNIIGEMKQKYNADWTLKMYDDDAVDRVVRLATRDGLIPLEEQSLFRRAHMVEKRIWPECCSCTQKKACITTSIAS